MQRHACLSKLRSNSLNYVSDDCAAEHLNIMKDMSVPMLSNLVLYVGGECLKLMDKAGDTREVGMMYLMYATHNS